MRWLRLPGLQVGNTLTTKVNGQSRGTIASPNLCKALMNLYLGPNSVTPDAKSSFGAGLAEKIKAAGSH